MYHDVYSREASESGFQNATAMKYKVSTEAFEQQVAAVRHWLDSQGEKAEQVLFTFDDGGNSFLNVIPAILEKYGFQGVFFIATQFIGSPGFLSRDDIRSLARRGHIIGSHSHTHPQRMSRLSNAQLSEEWSQSARILSEITGAPVTHASVPNGYDSEAVIRKMEECGYTSIYTSTPTTRLKHRNAATVYGRYAITDACSADDVMRLVSSPTYRLLLSARTAVMGVAKYLLGENYLKIRKKLLGTR